MSIGRDERWLTGEQATRIDRSARISVDAILHPTVEIGPNVVIYGDTTIGEGVAIFAGAVIGRPPKSAGIVPPKTSSSPAMVGPGCVIGANAVIYRGTVLEGYNLIGDGATIREDCFIGAESIIGNNSTVQNDVRTGRRVRVVDLSHLTAGLRIGHDVFWSVGVLSMNDNRHGDGLKAPTVDNLAFIGGGALLLPGVHIGEEAMVAAGSVVTHDVLANTRVQGIPARPYISPVFPAGGDPGYDGINLSGVRDA